MLTFLEFYETFLKFVMFKLFHTLDLRLVNIFLLRSTYDTPLLLSLVVSSCPHPNIKGLNAFIRYRVGNFSLPSLLKEKLFLSLALVSLDVPFRVY